MSTAPKSASHLAAYLRRMSRSYQLDIAAKTVENQLAVEVWDKCAGRGSTIRVWLPDDAFREYRWGPAGRDGWSARDGDHCAEDWIPTSDLVHLVLSELAELSRIPSPRP